MLIRIPFRHLAAGDDVLLFCSSGRGKAAAVAMYWLLTGHLILSLSFFIFFTLSFSHIYTALETSSSLASSHRLLVSKLGISFSFSLSLFFSFSLCLSLFPSSPSSLSFRSHQTARWSQQPTHSHRERDQRSCVHRSIYIYIFVFLIFLFLSFSPSHTCHLSLYFL